jgi:lauroyl/myristoyl acyltransferase
VSRAAGWFRRFAVRGVFWRQYLDWAIINLPFYMHFVLLCFWTLFFFFFAAPARRALVANFSVVLPGSSNLMNHFRAFRALYNFAWTITDAAVYKLTHAEFAYDLIGSVLLDQLATAHVAIVLTAHMGNYDLGAALFAQKFNRKIRMVRAPEADRQTEQHLESSLAQTGQGAVKIDYNTAGALLSFDLLNAVRQGEIVSIQGDRMIGDVARVDGTMFGRRIAVPSGPFILAQIAEVAIYPLFVVRNGYRRYAIIVRNPIDVQRSGNRDADIAAAVAQWCRTLETIVSQHWDQWFAFSSIFGAHV